MTERDKLLPSERSPIAVVGVSALFPGSVDATGFWRDILAGTDLLTDVPESHWLAEDYYDPDPAAPDKSLSRRGAFLPPVGFDCMEWGVPPSNVPATDTSQLLALIVARKVLEDATGGDFASVDRSRVSVILGVTTAQELLGSMVSRLQRPVWVKALRESGIGEDEVEAICDRIAAHYPQWQESTFPGALGNVVAGRIANRLDLGGTNCVTDAACASSFSALEMALQELELGDSDMVITGGVDTMNDIIMYMCFSKTHAMSPSDDCRPFSDKADGTILGEGLGMLALMRLADAERQKRRVYAVIKGLGASSDGRATSVYAPVPEGQARALRRAYANAGFGPEHIELVEAHGTGTRAGDQAEFKGLRQVYDGADRPDRPWCALGSVKSQIGHTKAAAGAAGLFKAVMALHHKVLPPTIKIERPDPGLALEGSPFYFNTRARPWVHDRAQPRRAAVSSFGFGGSNFHVAVEEYRGQERAPRLRSQRSELVVLGADDSASLARRCREVADGLLAGDLAFLAWSAAREGEVGRRHRLCLRASSEQDLGSALRLAAERLEAEPDRAFDLPGGIHYGCGSSDGELALLFPGQGSQYLDMGAELAMHFDAAREVWDGFAGSMLDGSSPIHRLVFPQPVFEEAERQAQQDRLRATEWAQPAICCASLATLALLEQLGLNPSCAAGHSLGELCALHAASAMQAEDLLRVARRRGELMAQAALQAREPGGMTAVAGSAERVRELLARRGGRLVLANHNSPRQVVVSGPLAELEELEAALGAEGLVCKRLDVACAFHSPLVSEAAEPFGRFLSGIDFGACRMPVYANSTAEPYPDDARGMRELLAMQVARPVRFVEMIRAMHARGVRTFVELGPGQVLTRLVQRILAGEPHRAVSLDRKDGGLDAFLDGIGQLAAAGCELDLRALWRGYRAPLDPRQRSEARLAVEICGSNRGKLYPPPEGRAGIPPPNPPRERRPAEKPPREAAPLEAPPAVAGFDPDWLQAFQDAQRQTAEAHVAYQRAMAQAHSAYLQSVALTPRPPLPETVDNRQIIEKDLCNTAERRGMQVEKLRFSTVSEGEGGYLAAGVTGLAQDAFAAGMSKGAAAAMGPGSASLPSAAVVAEGLPSAAGGQDLMRVMLEVVADKTGYPVEMIELGMDLEGDLGIDSIKRVEILSEVRERAPG
ncbi:MAG: acyltransferase domain-containing protein, partial [Deltaproteobacteria bacterium]|nr:acyltransferase domain-containing protein [Deltaproteobacteria bacterium]